MRTTPRPPQRASCGAREGDAGGSQALTPTPGLSPGPVGGRSLSHRFRPVCAQSWASRHAECVREKRARSGSEPAPTPRIRSRSRRFRPVCAQLRASKRATSLRGKRRRSGSACERRKGEQDCPPGRAAKRTHFVITDLQIIRCANNRTQAVLFPAGERRLRGRPAEHDRAAHARGEQAAGSNERR